MSLEEQLFEIERGCWVEGPEYCAAQLGERCLLSFPQSGEMYGLFSLGEILRGAIGSF